MPAWIWLQFYLQYYIDPKKYQSWPWGWGGYNHRTGLDHPGTTRLSSTSSLGQLLYYWPKSINGHKLLEGALGSLGTTWGSEISGYRTWVQISAPLATSLWKRDFMLCTEDLSSISQYVLIILVPNYWERRGQSYSTVDRALALRVVKLDIISGILMLPWAREQWSLRAKTGESPEYS